MVIHEITVDGQLKATAFEQTKKRNREVETEAIGPRTPQQSQCEEFETVNFISLF
jgi:hypothetical protein